MKFFALATLMALAVALPTVHRTPGLEPVVLGYKRNSDDHAHAHGATPGSTRLGYKREANLATAGDVDTVEPGDSNLPDGTVVPTYGCPVCFVSSYMLPMSCG